ncbi:hypothetical protein T440DRAFT_471132 [Plenodomus tracheiphilus IPT5]|uniref:Uncharacterized protein n=1 Tax=Plenodomus tracheiphilus IPT5 TaxID=1408161 RepID=A0A6A7AWH6_9PLEO|nr:hypothetical protein T440DRAFT_471132 [Plenodomus tracheiphilus IPT5]
MASHDLFACPNTPSTSHTNHSEKQTRENDLVPTLDPWPGSASMLVSGQKEAPHQAVAQSVEGNIKRSLKQGARGLGTYWDWLLITSSDTWLPEIVALATSLGLLIGLSVLFAVWNGQFASKWATRLSFPSIILIIAKASRAALGVPITSCLSQLAWIHFQEVRAALDFQRFDAASRSSVEVIRLLWSVRNATVLLVVLIVIPGLGFEAAAQQCLSLQGPTRVPILKHLKKLGDLGYVNAMVGSGLRGAAKKSLSADTAHSGLDSAVFSIDTITYTPMARTILPETLEYACAGTGCTPRPYATLSLCSACRDISDGLTITSDHTASLPNGSSANNRSNILSMKSGFVAPDNGYLTSSPIILANFTLISWLNQTTPFNFMGNNAFLAHECVVTLCTRVNQLDISRGTTSASGVTETTLATFDQTSRREDCLGWEIAVPDDAVLMSPNHGTSTWQEQNPRTQHEDTSPECKYVIEYSSIQPLSDYVASIMVSNVTFAWTEHESPVFGPVPQSRDSPGTVFWNSLSWAITASNYSSRADASFQIDAAFSSIVISLANWARNFTFRQPGLGWGIDYSGPSENTFHIHWSWFTLPATVEVLTALLLYVTVRRTRRARLPIWKSNVLATLLQGVNMEEGGFHRIQKSSDLESLAKDMTVRLSLTASGYRLVDSKED